MNSSLCLGISLPRNASYFDYEYEKCAIAFLNDYDNGSISIKSVNDVKLELLNDNFTVMEISKVVESLKNNKSPGLDCIPSEFIKFCKHELVDIITLILNYVIKYREFPDRWEEGLRTPVFKNGRVDDTDNYRGITVLSVFAKIFETAVNNRIAYASEAFREDDETNGGFLKDSCFGGSHSSSAWWIWHLILLIDIYSFTNWWNRDTSVKSSIHLEAFIGKLTLRSNVMACWVHRFLTNWA